MKDNDSKLIFEMYVDRSGGEAFSVVQSLMASGVYKIVRHEREDGGGWNMYIKHEDYPIVIELFGKKDIVAYVKIEYRDPFTAPEAPPKMKEFSHPIDADDIIGTLIEITRDFD